VKMLLHKEIVKRSCPILRTAVQFKIRINHWAKGWRLAILGLQKVNKFYPYRAKCFPLAIL
jgi:hypothetical protein